MDLQRLLRRPRDLPLNVTRDSDSQRRDRVAIGGAKEQGVYLQWSAKAVFSRQKLSLPRVFVGAEARVRYAQLIITGRWPPLTLSFPLVSICYIEPSPAKGVDIRGRWFRLILHGVGDSAAIVDALRFLVVRQRVPHSLLGLPFDWQKEKSKTKPPLANSTPSSSPCTQRKPSLLCCKSRVDDVESL